MRGLSTLLGMYVGYIGGRLISGRFWCSCLLAMSNEILELLYVGRHSARMECITVSVLTTASLGARYTGAPGYCRE